MRRTLLGITLLLVATLPAVAQKKPKLPKPGQSADIVFVGNSYTFFNDLPAMVRALGKTERPARDISTTLLAPGGCTLQLHWTRSGKEAPVKLIRSKRPDYVVLQEQSRRPLDDPKLMHEFAGKLAKEIRRRKAVPVWFMTWARQHQPECQDEIRKQYELAHKKNGGLLAPVGRAWQTALQAQPALQLHNKDRSHPNPQGSYLAACVIHGTIFGSDVTRFPDKLALKTPNGKQRVLIELKPQIGRRLRAAAAKVLAAQQKPKSTSKQKRSRR